MSGQLIVLGSTSSIARFVVPQLGYESKNILLIDRGSSSIPDPVEGAEHIRINFENSKVAESELKKVFSSFGGRQVVVLSFIGSYGEVNSLAHADIDEVSNTILNNFKPFLAVAKAAMYLPKNSAVIAFAGAGVGGDNLDDSSIGYLASKSAMCVTIEAIQNQLDPFNVHFGLISPGAFPSRMQEVVASANPSEVQEARIERAKSVMTNQPNPERLVNMINFLTVNPEILGGRSWSANFDPMQTMNLPENFGRIRRVF